MNRRLKERALRQYLAAPKDVAIYQGFTDGSLYVVKNNEIREVSLENKFELHTFITPGNQAFYLEGTTDTSEDNPNNATAKFGLSESHHHFEPHVHGSRHIVFSLGYSGALLRNLQTEENIEIRLQPNSLIDLPGGIPHAFYNRSPVPLLTFIVNGGLGVNNEKYAITKKEALANGNEDLAHQLGLLEENLNRRIKTMSAGEKIGSFFKAASEIASLL